MHWNMILNKSIQAMRRLASIMLGCQNVAYLHTLGGRPLLLQLQLTLEALYVSRPDDFFNL